MKAKVTAINGLYIEYITENGYQDIDDSTFNEIMNVKVGDIIELSQERMRDAIKMRSENG